MSVMNVIVSILLIIAAFIIGKKFTWPLIIGAIKDLGSHRLRKEIVGVNTFDDSDHARMSRNKAILARTKWKRSFHMAVFAGVLYWAISILTAVAVWIQSGRSSFESSNVIALFVELIIYLAAERNIGEWYGRYFLFWVFGGFGPFLFLYL